jgi:hypothetical protein
MLFLKKLWDPADSFGIQTKNGVGSALDRDWPLRRVA